MDHPEGVSTRTGPYDDSRPNPQNLQNYLDPSLRMPEVPLYEQQVPNTDTTTRPQQVSRRNFQGTSADSSAAVTGELHQLVHAPEGVLPSDMVKYPSVQSGDGASYTTLLVILLALVVADVVACLRGH